MKFHFPYFYILIHKDIEENTFLYDSMIKSISFRSTQLILRNETIHCCNKILKLIPVKLLNEDGGE